MGTYSFLDVECTLVGPGASLQLGNGSGSAEEGIDVDMIEEKDGMVVGSDGTIMHSLRASNAGSFTLRLLKTSPLNAKLQDLYNLQKTSSGLWGQNVIVISDVQRGDVITGTQMAFNKQSPVKYAKDGNVNEWKFQGSIQQILGTGQPSNA